MVAVDEVLKTLSTVIDPDLKKDIVSMGMIKDLEINGNDLKFTLELTTHACPFNSEIEADVRKAVSSIPGVGKFDMKVTAKVMEGRALSMDEMMPTVKNIIGVASGKGGVGKTTVSVNLALALAQSGAKVGLLDADIYGPSVPLMLGAAGQPVAEDGKILPLDRYGLRVMSVGYLLGDRSPVIWRGPLVAHAVRQLLHEVRWGELDYLIVDLPPGTGDAQLTLVQSVPLTGGIIVTTPSAVALLDAEKGLQMFTKVHVPVLGIVENMSYFVCPHCHGETDVFSR